MLIPCYYTPFNIITGDYNATLVDKRKWGMTEKVWLGLRCVTETSLCPPLALPAPPPYGSPCSLFRAALTIRPIGEAKTFSLFSAAKTLPNIVVWIKYPRTIFQQGISLAFSMPGLVIMELRHHGTETSVKLQWGPFVCFKPALSLSPLKQFPVWHTRITIDWRLVLPDVCAVHRRPRPE